MSSMLSLRVQDVAHVFLLSSCHLSPPPPPPLRLERALPLFAVRLAQPDLLE